MSDESFSGESGQRADSVSGRDSTYQTELWGFKALVGVEARICKRAAAFMPGCCAPSGQEVRHAGFFPDHICW